jgi:hypothetical protein
MVRFDARVKCGAILILLILWTRREVEGDWKLQTEDLSERERRQRACLPADVSFLLVAHMSFAPSSA